MRLCSGRSLSTVSMLPTTGFPGGLGIRFCAFEAAIDAPPFSRINCENACKGKAVDGPNPLPDADVA